MLLHPVTFGHQGFAFNGHLNQDGSVLQSAVEVTSILDSRQINSGYRDLRDPYHLTQGGSLGRVHKGFTAIRLAGRLVVPKASQRASLSDRERALLAAFDPYLCYLDSPSTDGAYALDFYEDTTDTATYSSPFGLIPLRYYCRPAEKPSLSEVLTDRGARPFSIGLIAADPRQYEQTEQTLVLTPGSASGAVVNRGTVPSSLKATIVMSGAGNAAFTITRGGVSFILNLAGTINADQIVVVMETCGPYGRGRLITKNGVENFALKTSGPSTWLTVPVGSTTFAISNTGNVTSCTLAWRSARA